MSFFIRKAPFYFLRHAQTDHNVHRIYDDKNEIEINQNGVQQAIKLQQTIASLPIATVCSSPLRRVQQTKEIVLKNKVFRDVVLEDLRECPSALWRLFLASESRPLTNQEWELIQIFINRIEQGLNQALQQDDPLLLIAHGGTYWALSHLLRLEGDRKIDNCVLVKICPDQQETWKAKFIS
ncbi:MAG: hypothetical protein C5B45_04235 [Chlamydiae bacterium]|nr:MAG: hypothetical protein C5B45_04235 [Chlamydiota bacterium]